MVLAYKSAAQMASEFYLMPIQLSWQTLKGNDSRQENVDKTRIAAGSVIKLFFFCVIRYAQEQCLKTTYVKAHFVEELFCKPVGQP